MGDYAIIFVSPAIPIWATIVLVTVAGGYLGKNSPRKNVIFIVINSSLAVFLLGGFCGCVVNNKLSERAVELYISRARPVLKRIYRETGVYPQTLPEKELGRVPRLIRNEVDYYTSDGESYAIRCNNTIVRHWSPNYD
jgi:hypothetical protein